MKSRLAAHVRQRQGSDSTTSGIEGLETQPTTWDRGYFEISRTMGAGEESCRRLAVAANRMCACCTDSGHDQLIAHRADDDHADLCCLRSIYEPISALSPGISRPLLMPSPEPGSSSANSRWPQSALSRPEVRSEI